MPRPNYDIRAKPPTASKRDRCFHKQMTLWARKGQAFLSAALDYFPRPSSEGENTPSRMLWLKLETPGLDLEIGLLRFLVCKTGRIEIRS